MFLKNLINVWKSKSLLSEALDEFDTMMEKTDWMFDTARKIFSSEIESNDVEEHFYATDKQVNESERAIRKKIIEHLTLNPGMDVPACLVLMSVTKDCERVGDYCKNLFELISIYGSPIKNGETVDSIRDLEEKTEVVHSRTRKAFKRSDSALARECIDTARRVGRICDEMVGRLMKSDYPVDKAVTFVLTYRYIKRVTSHLANICSTVLNPVPEIDYFEDDEDNEDS